jgi:hypothetical protein
VGAFRDYTDRVKGQFMASPPEQLQVMQGMAREASLMLGMFEECVKVADKIAESRK